jgi:hypothetical protein
MCFYASEIIKKYFNKVGTFKQTAFLSDVVVTTIIYCEVFMTDLRIEIDAL